MCSLKNRYIVYVYLLLDFYIILLQFDENTPNKLEQFEKAIKKISD